MGQREQGQSSGLSSLLGGSVEASEPAAGATSGVLLAYTARFPPTVRLAPIPLSVLRVLFPLSGPKFSKTALGAPVALLAALTSYRFVSQTVMQTFVTNALSLS